MSFDSIVEKLDEYQKRLAEGKVDRIKPEHVRKAIGKLKAKKAELVDELSETTKPEKRERLARKLATIEDQIGRADWLEQQIHRIAQK